MTLLGTHRMIMRDRLARENVHAYGFLREHPAGVLATVDPNGDPHAAAIYYAVDRSLTITFLTKEDTKKSHNLAHYNHAMLTVFDEKLQTTVQITGIVSKITDSQEISQLFRNMIRASLHTGRNAVPPIIRLHKGQFVGYRLQPVQVRLSTYSHTNAHRSGKMFETIDIPV